MKRKTKLYLGCLVLLAICVAGAAYSYSLLNVNVNASFMQAVLTYTDGTVRVIDSRDVKEGAIIDLESGKAVSSVWVGLYATPVYTGEPVGYSVQGTASCQIWRGIQLKLYDSGSVALQPQNNPLQGSGKPVLVCSATLTASWLENAVSKYEDGATYTLKYSITSFSMTLEYGDGSSQTQTVDPITMAWTFKYSKTGATGSFLSLSISFQKYTG
jgi:hypothetical protein